MNNFKQCIFRIALTSLVLTSCFASSIDAIPTSISQINRNLIDLYKKRITQQLIRNRYERMAITCATAAVVAAGGWYAFKTPAIAEQPLHEDSNKIIAETNDFSKKSYVALVKIASYLETIAKNRNEKPVSVEKTTPPTLLQAWGTGIWNTCKIIGHNAVIQMGVLVVSGVLPLPRPIARLLNYWGDKVEKVGEHFYHDADFHWFVTSQTQAVPYFNDLERAAELLPLSMDQEDREHQKKTMIWTADVLVRQLARIIAFMEYQAEKLKSLNTGCSIQMMASSKYMYRHVGQFSETLQAMIQDRTKHAEIPAYIKSFRERLRSEQDSFCINEHAALYDISSGEV